MDGSTIKGDMEWNDSDAGIRKSSSMISKIYVKGYDTLLPGIEVVKGLKKRFGSCGEVIYVYIPGYDFSTTRRLNSFALIYLRGEGAEEKALKLSGSKMGERMLVAESYPFHAIHLDSELSPMRVLDNQRSYTMFVTGHDPSLPMDAVEGMLMRLFSQCGCIRGLAACACKRRAALTVVGEDTLEMALQLSGRYVEGLGNIEVSEVVGPEGPIHDWARIFPMDGCTTKGDMEWNDSDAGIRERSSRISRIYVKGYDTWLPGIEVVNGLKKHFGSCGEVIYVYIPGYVFSTTRRLNSFALIYLRGEGAEEKALKLSGSKMGERMLVAESYPFHAIHLDSELSPMRVLDNKRSHTIFVTGHDPSLPMVAVEGMLMRIFSQCGWIRGAAACSCKRQAALTVVGENTLERALELSGRYVEGVGNIEVSEVVAPEGQIHDWSRIFPMDRSTIKGDMEWNDSDAGIRKSSSMISRIYVKGYDTRLPGIEVVNGLKKHFGSCGEVIYVYIPGYDFSTTRRLKSFVLIYLRGEGAEEKALKLSGSKMGERMLVAKSYPFHAIHLDSELSPMRVLDNNRSHTMFVKGYDPSLPIVAVESMLMKHFSQCGWILTVVAGKREAVLTAVGEDALEKVLQLSGRYVEGLGNIEVSKVVAPQQPRHDWASRANFPFKSKMGTAEKKKKNKTAKKETTEWKALY